jgi:uncharacterized membrane protein YfcA
MIEPVTYYLLLTAIGAVMGLFGGLLGIGGSVVMIPALVLAFGENQHLYQASAMICNFFVAAAATFAHKREDVLVGRVIRYLIPASVAGSIAGVMLSNAAFFSGQRSYLLARTFGLFLVYVTVHNAARLYHDFRPHLKPQRDMKDSALLSAIIGLATGLFGGLLGIGGGTICIPLQQVLLRMPLKKAIANSAATIILIAAVGAILKNVTLYEHDIAAIESLKIAVAVIPSAIIAGFAGARLVHVLPKKYVRMVFIALLVLASYKMLRA